MMDGSDSSETPFASEDEYAMFVELSTMLADGIEANLTGWTVRNIERVALAAGITPDDSLRQAANDAGERCRARVGPLIHELLAADVDDQRSTPLVVVRDAVSYATEVLEAMGVPAVQRDAFEQRSFPADVYGLSPAAMSDVHESLGELAVMWGAAKAHIHMRRHTYGLQRGRDSGPSPDLPSGS